jgi:pimeloyl-ACP methyl ester carboxylesterase
VSEGGGNEACRPQPVEVAGCLGWLHLPPGRASGRGVVICAPWGYEALAAYRGLYELGQACAAAGLTTLRFDPPGAGDSPGEGGRGSLSAMRTAILDAACWLGEQAGIVEVALCGLRIGALMAVAAAASRPGRFTTLALLAPVWSGQAFRRQVLLAARTTGTEDGDWLETRGERLHREELAEIAREDLAVSLSAARPRRVLVLERDVSHREMAGCGDVVFRRFEGADGLLSPPHAAHRPIAELGDVAAWLADGAPTSVQRVEMPAPPILAADEGVLERPLRFGEGGALTGVLCEPAEGPRRRLAALILNTGAEPRAGVGRFGVRLARHLARIGVTSLRMDATGVGDSDPVPGAEDPAAPPDVYRDTLIAEARAGLDRIAAGEAARFLVIGVCSGAHVALQLALRDARAGGIVLLNLPAFDRSAGGAPSLDGGPPPGEIPLLRRPRMLVRRLMAEADNAIARRLGVESGLDRPGRWMRALSARGARVLLAYSDRDRGLRELRAHFGRRGRRLAGMANVRRVVLDGTEHSIAPRAMQAQVLELIEQEALLLDGMAVSPVRAATTAPRKVLGTPLPGASMPAG